jgi:hypothetical protein
LWRTERRTATATRRRRGDGDGAFCVLCHHPSSRAFVVVVDAYDDRGAWMMTQLDAIERKKRRRTGATSRRASPRRRRDGQERETRRRARRVAR